MSVWDEIEIDEVVYLNLDKVGAGIKGVITDVTTKKWDDGSSCPQLTIRRDGDGEEIVWSAGQTQAKRQLKDLRPSIGDHIAVELIDIEKRGSKTLKHITVDVTPASVGSPAPAALAAGGAVAGGGGAPAGIDPAAWVSLDDSRRAELLSRMGTTAGAGAGDRTPPPF